MRTDFLRYKDVLDACMDDVEDEEVRTIGKNTISELFSHISKMVAPRIDYNEPYERHYIPMPGGWEVQTKGKGSSFRLCDAEGDRLNIPDSPYLHETLTRMARDINAACGNPL